MILALMVCLAAICESKGLVSNWFFKAATTATFLIFCEGVQQKEREREVNKGRKTYQQ